MRLVTISESILPGKSIVSVQNSPASQKRTIALIGPPNSGKSTLFNRLTMLNQKIANYPGVTVEHRMGKLVCADTSEIELVDLPGVYGLTPYSEDEAVASRVLRGEMPGVARPDAVLIVLDSTRLERGGSLTGSSHISAFKLGG